MYLIRLNGGSEHACNPLQHLKHPRFRLPPVSTTAFQPVVVVGVFLALSLALALLVAPPTARFQTLCYKNNIWSIALTNMVAKGLAQLALVESLSLALLVVGAFLALAPPT